MSSGPSTQTTTNVQSTAPSNPDVNPTLSKLLKGVQSQYDANPNGVNVDMNLYGGLGGTTQNALGSLLSGANNPTYSNAVNQGLSYNSALGAAGGFANGQAGDVGNIRGVGAQFGQIASQPGGFVSGQAGDVGNIRGVGSQFGQIASQSANPSLTENTLMQTALGNRYGMNDPGYAALRSGLQDDVTTANLSAFNNSGMFGSDSNRGQLTRDLTRELGGLDYANFQNDRDQQMRALSSIEGMRQQGVNNRLSSLGAQQGAAQSAFGMDQQGLSNRMNALGAQQGAAQSAFGMGQQGVNNAMAAQAALPGLYQASLAPMQAALAAGQMQDADRQAQLQAQYEQRTRAAQAPTDYLAKLSSLLAGNAATGGSTSTGSSTVPIQQPSPLQLLLGGGLGLASLF